MSAISKFFTDPVWFFSFTGLAILIGMFIFFGVFFWYKTTHD